MNIDILLGVICFVAASSYGFFGSWKMLYGELFHPVFGGWERYRIIVFCIIVQIAWIAGVYYIITRFTC